MTTRTVKFNVGGTIYEVSMSLIESFPSTLLATVIDLSPSNTKDCEDPDAPIFIDRNAERFQYCLDYMRDGEVWLPNTVSKQALLKDLDYFGFDKDAVATKIHEPSSIYASAVQLAACKTDHESLLKHAQCSEAAEQLVYEFLMRLTRGESLDKMQFNRGSKVELEASLFNYCERIVIGGEIAQAIFQKRLSEYGLSSTGVEKKAFRTCYDVTVEKKAG